MSAFVEGVRDILPAELKKRREVYQKIRNFFEANAYREVITPTLESIKLYAGIDGVVDNSEMFKVFDDRGQILVLRPDLTMPIARLAASRFKNSPRPLRFSYLSSYFQSKNSQSLSLKERTQAGIELIGANSLKSDLEILIILIKTLKKIGVENPLIDIGHADLINEVFADLEIAPSEKKELRQLLAAKNKVGIKNYLKKVNLSAETASFILSLPTLFGSPKKIIKKMERMPLSQATNAVLNKLKKLFFRLEEFKLLKYINFDPILISRHGYYTGLIFKGYARGYSNLLANGGRYDNLTKKFGLEEPAVGFALEIEALLNYLNRTENFIKNQKKQFLISYRAEKDLKSAYKLADNLREKEFVAEVYNEADSEYLEFQQIDFQLYLTADQIRLENYEGQKTVIARDNKQAAEDLILNKIEEWK